MRARTAKAMRAGGTTSTKPTRATQVRFGDRARYLFDNSMSRGTPALIAWLSAITLLLIVVFSVIVTIFRLRSGASPAPRGFVHELFYSLLHALDPGTVAGDDGTWRYIVTMLLLTIAGLFIVSALIGVIAAGIDEKLAELRRGRSIVLERDHTVILGWSDSIFTIISELTIANESRNRPVVVVLADRDKVEMEDAIRAKVPDQRGTRVLCRSGSPMDLDDLRLSSHHSARSVIVLAPEGSDDPDSEVIKTLLALTHEGTGEAGIVAEIRNPTNLEAARLVGTERTVLLDIRDTVAKLLVQTSRQSGAAAVYTELFDYDGDEIYFLEQHALGALTYGDALLAFETASLIGLIHDGVPSLNPPHDTLIGNRTLILLAEDDDGLDQLSTASVQPDLSLLGTETPVVDVPTRAVLIGWNDRAPIVLSELDKYAPPGSELTVLTTFGDPVLPRLTNLAVTVVAGATTDRATLDRHVVDGLDQLIVLCYSEHLGAQAADARTLVTLLHVRDILGKLGAETPVVSEMLDDRNRVLAEVAHVDDVVVSGEFISLVVTQLSEDSRLEAVFDELLGDEGSEIYLRPADWYVAPGVEVSYATVVAGARQRGETAIGFKSGSDVVVNPSKARLFTAHPDDRVVVLAER
ncbi:lipoprotein [soil metagenome]